MPVFGAIGAAVAGSLAGATIAATSLGAIALGVVTTAVVGAAIGGLTAAVTGGDIGKGMLFGAIGTVATAGIMSGIGAATGTMGNGTFGIGAQGLQSTGWAGGQVFDSVTGEVFAGTAKEATSGLFGNALGGILDKGVDTIGGTLLTKGIDFAAGAFTDEPYNPNMDPDFLRENREDIQAHDKDMAKLAASLRGGGGGGGGSKLPWQSTEAGVKYTLAEQWKQANLAEDSAMSRLQKQFELQDNSMEKEHNMLTAKFGESAELSGTQKFEGATDEQKQAIIDKQSGGGDEAALQGA